MNHICAVTVPCLLLTTLAITVGINIALAEEYIPIKEECWNNLEEWQRFHITVRDSAANEQLSIAGYYFTKSIVREFYGGHLAHEAQAYVNAVEATWPGRAVLAVAVSPWGSQSSAPFFSPTNFKFSQDLSRYSIDTNQDIRGEKMFFGGKLRAVTAGFIVIPKDINLNKSFKIWYDKQYAKMARLE